MPDRVTLEATSRRRWCPPEAPDFVRSVTAEMMAGRGDALPVSALPVDGSFPSGTAAFEKRNISDLVAVWDPDTCIQCGNCSFVCPHSVIRTKLYDRDRLDGAPETFPSAPLDAVGLPETVTRCRYTSRIAPDAGYAWKPARQSHPAPRPPRRSISHRANRSVAARARHIEFFETMPQTNRSRVDFGTVRGAQFLQPLFEFPGACAGCGETPYLKLLSQLFGDRLMIANATGCSSIYGGNLPTTPWTTNSEGRGPAWSNSLFEDNAEFGLGFRLAADTHTRQARQMLSEQRDVLGADLVDAILSAPQLRESELGAQRERVAELQRRLDRLAPAVADELRSVIDHLIRRSVWIVGGDGWAYDIGAGGLDHVLASGRNINVLVLDTEVYSNTGGQMSKATPLGAVAKFAAAGKTVPKKDLALQAIAYGSVYVARVAMGADPQQTLQAFREAEAYDGPSIVIAYSHCIAHGIEMRYGLDQQYRAVASGHWPLLRYDPARARHRTHTVPAGFPPTADCPDRLSLPRAALSGTGQLPPRRGRAAARAGAGVDRSALENLRRHGLSRSASTFRPTPARTVDGPVHPLPGLTLRNPLVAAASPLSRTVDGVRRLADAGSARWCSTRCSRSSSAAKPSTNARLVAQGTESYPNP